MKRMFLTIMVISLSFIVSQTSCYAQNKSEVKTPEEMAAMETEKLGSLLHLEDWQLFYVDSTLQHNYANLQEELQKLQRSRVENTNIYMSIREKWMEKTDESFKKYFTEEQWDKYLRNMGRGRKDKEKSTQKKQKK